MAGKDLQKYQTSETSFIEYDQRSQEVPWQLIEAAEADQPAEVMPQSGFDSGVQPRPAKPGFMMRIGRGVKSAVGGAVNMIMQSGMQAIVSLL